MSTVGLLLIVILIIEVDGQCSSTNRRAIETDTVTQEPTYLTSPGWKRAYYSNTDCRWELSTTGGERIIVDVMESYFEGSPGCSYDYLGIYDGNSLSSPATRLCNNLRSGQLFVSSGDHVVLRLKSDFSVNYPGFMLRYFIGTDHSVSCGTNSVSATTTLQYLSSPNFPNEYDATQECTWSIASSGTSIRIEVLLSDMLDGEICYSDHLYIYDGTDDTGTLLADICDSSATFIDSVEYFTNTSNAFIKFVTLTSGRNRRGFLLAYNQTDTVVATQTTTPSSTYSTCSSYPVSITASSSAVYVSSPDYPVFYANNLNCQWKITGPQGSVLQIRVVDFYLEDSENCFGDRVTIYDGSTSSYPQLSRRCGEIGIDVNTTGNTALIDFRTDSSTSARGFKYEITNINGGRPVCVNGNPTNLTATLDRQYFQSSNYPNNYDSSATSQWLIYNSMSSDYEIVIDVVDSIIENSVNCYADKVHLYQGPCSSYPTLGTFCGLRTPTFIQSNGLYVLMTFTTDETVTNKGFNISYYLQKVTDTGLSAKEIVGIIVGVVVAVVALGLIGFAIYKGVSSSSAMKAKHGSKSSLRSRSSSSSSSSSDDEEKAQKAHRKGPKLKPITTTKVKLPPSNQYSLPSKLPGIKGK